MAERNGLAVIQPSSITTADEQVKLDTFRRTYASDLSDDEFALTVEAGNRLGLDLFAGEIHGIKFNGKLAVTPSISGLRKLASQTGLMDGIEGPFWCGPDGQWRELWLEEKPPVAAKCTVYRKGASRGFTAIVTWKERARYYFDRNTRAQKLMPTWAAMPAHMLGKVAEADAIRKAKLTPTAMPADEDPEARHKAYARLHAAAEAKGLSHDQARAAVAALVPGIESLTSDEVMVEDIHDAADLIDAIGVNAVEVVDEETGEIISAEPSALEQWRMEVRDVVEAGGRKAEWDALCARAEKDRDRWAVLMELAPNEATRSQLTTKARIAGMYSDAVVEAKQVSRDGQQVARVAQQRQQADLAPGEPPLDGEYVEAPMFAASNPDRYTK